MSVNFEMVFWVIDFLQKTNEQIRLYYYDTSGRLVFVRFLEEINDPKKPFRNLLTFRSTAKARKSLAGTVHMWICKLGHSHLYVCTMYLSYQPIYFAQMFSSIFFQWSAMNSHMPLISYHHQYTAPVAMNKIPISNVCIENLHNTDRNSLDTFDI